LQQAAVLHPQLDLPPPVAREETFPRKLSGYPACIDQIASAACFIWPPSDEVYRQSVAERRCTHWPPPHARMQRTRSAFPRPPRRSSNRIWIISVRPPPTSSTVCAAGMC